MSGIDRELTLEIRTNFIDKHLPGTQKTEIEWEFAEIWADTLIYPPYILMLVKEN